MIVWSRLIAVVALCLTLVAGASVALAETPRPAEAPALAGNGPYTPPACVPGVPFTDITCTTGFDPWIEQFGLDGITAGCGGGNYCPGTPVTRDQMAVFIEKSMRGTSNWPPHTVLVFHHQAAEAGSNVNSGSELLALVAAIPSTGPEAPSAGNHWQIRVGPGVYDLGSGSLTLPAYTALEGAGQDVTVITAAGYASFAGTVIMGNQSALSRLTVDNSSSGGTYGIAVFLPTGASNVALEHVNVTATHASNANGVGYGLFTMTGTSFRMVDCDVTARGAFNNTGIAAASTTDESRLDGVVVKVSGSSVSSQSHGLISVAAGPAITNSRFYVADGGQQFGIIVTGGGGPLDLRNSEVYTYGAGAALFVDSTNADLVGVLLQSATGDGINTNGGGPVMNITGSAIKGGANWLYNGAGFAVTVGASKLVGPTTNSGGTVSCFGNYTGSAFLASTCP